MGTPEWRAARQGSSDPFPKTERDSAVWRGSPRIDDRRSQAGSLPGLGPRRPREAGRGEGHFAAGVRAATLPRPQLAGAAELETRPLP